MKNNFRKQIVILLALLAFDVSAAAIKQGRGDLSFRYQDYFDNIGGSPGNRWWGEFNFAYEGKEPFVDDEINIDFTLRRNDEAGLFYAVREAQYTSLGSYNEVSFGIVIIDWSQIDSVWGLGKINNRVNIDFFNPEQSGLPAVLFQQRLTKNFTVGVFGSFLYIPELNPPLIIDKGNQTISSRNPWAIAPNRTTLINGVVKPIRYIINEPDIVDDVIFHPSYGVNLKYSFTEHFHFTTFYIRKPENSLSSSASVVLDNITLIPEVTVSPKIYFHQLWGGQVTFETFDKRVQLYTSYLMSQPGSKPQNTEPVAYGGYAFRLEKQDEEYWGTGIRYFFHGGEVHAGHLSRVSSFEESDILKRPRWGEAVNFSLSYGFFKDFLFKAESFYDYSTFDRLFAGKLTYNHNQVLALSLGANVLTSPQNGKGFWAKYKTNDSVYSEISILF